MRIGMALLTLNSNTRIPRIRLRALAVSPTHIRVCDRLLLSIRYCRNVEYVGGDIQYVAGCFYFMILITFDNIDITATLIFHMSVNI